jgi:O-antigen ligase
MLGGFTLVFLCGPAAFFLLGARPRAWALALFAVGASLLVLTFSRSAWVGLAIAGVVLVFHHRKIQLKRLLVLVTAGLTGLLATAVPLRELIFVRVGRSDIATEEFSNQTRAWLIQGTLSIIRDHPVFGVGAGAYIVERALRAPYGFLVEPVHNLPLLLIAELGLPGVLLLILVTIVISVGILRANRPDAVLFSAIVAGLLATMLFDHYLWSLAPGRMLLGLVLGLWAAQAGQQKDERDVTNTL